MGNQPTLVPLDLTSPGYRWDFSGCHRLQMCQRDLFCRRFISFDSLAKSEVVKKNTPIFHWFIWLFWTLFVWKKHVSMFLIRVVLAGLWRTGKLFKKQKGLPTKHKTWRGFHLADVQRLTSCGECQADLGRVEEGFAAERTFRLDFGESVFRFPGCWEDERFLK